ncbi:MAG: hypothetical protein AAFX81_10585 [Pseudomonadota bacterium]
MTRGRDALLVVLRLRERARDEARHRLACASRTLAAFEQKRLGWRQRATAEAASGARGPADRDLARWIEGARFREWVGAAEADTLRAAVSAAAAACRRADMAVEQIEQLRLRQATAANRLEARRAQAKLDDLRPSGMAHDG